MAWFHRCRHPRKLFKSKPDMVTLRDMMLWTTARPSRINRTYLELGNNWARYTLDLRVNGSLLHKCGAGSPCLATTSNMKAAKAESMTSSDNPASCKRFHSRAEWAHWLLIPNNRGMTRVSSPHRISGCASNIARIRVVPLRGTPPTNIKGMFRS